MSKTIEELRTRSIELLHIKDGIEDLSAYPVVFDMEDLIIDMGAKIDELWERFREVNDAKQDLAFRHNSTLLLASALQRENEKYKRILSELKQRPGKSKIMGKSIQCISIDEGVGDE